MFSGFIEFFFSFVFLYWLILYKVIRGIFLLLKKFLMLLLQMMAVQVFVAFLLILIRLDSICPHLETRIFRSFTSFNHTIVTV